jgi:excisionase family DNA binding protein
MDNSKSRLLTAKEAAAYLGISLSTLNRIEKEAGLIPFRTPGGHRRYDRKMLDEYLESTRMQPAEKVEVVIRSE